MNDLIRRDAELTMSSREIADLVESRHDTVKLSIERLAEKGLIAFTSVAEKSTGGRPSTEYRVNERDSYVVVAQLCPAFTARLVDRWQELEAQMSAPQVPRSFAEALRLAANQAELLEQQRPAVEFAHAVRNTADAIAVGDLARVLGYGQNVFFRMLRADHLLMEGNRPYQTYIDRGYFRVIEGVWRDSDGAAHLTFKTLVTGKGQVFLQRKYGKEAAVA
ncbi:phage antirepressor KilAC domain-containing protein [Pandoraea pnomenusa]|uniref:phage antirepressor KilAC domain-containing protein n=1 Tax=Pandoraea pnomenusa TaxID=93220 RepID=UPI0033416EBD